MLAFLSIPILAVSFFFYQVLTRWLHRRDAGTYATFVALGSSCCVFLFGFLPLEFSGTLRLFGLLALLSIPCLVVVRRKETKLPSASFAAAQRPLRDIFEERENV